MSQPTPTPRIRIVCSNDGSYKPISLADCIFKEEDGVYHLRNKHNANKAYLAIENVSSSKDGFENGRCSVCIRPDYRIDADKKREFFEKVKQQLDFSSVDNYKESKMALSTSERGGDTECLFLRINSKYAKVYKRLPTGSLRFQSQDDRSCPQTIDRILATVNIRESDKHGWWLNVNAFEALAAPKVITINDILDD
jgi:hypothetical protein